MIELRDILSYSRRHESQGEADFIAVLLDHLKAKTYDLDGSELTIDGEGNIWFENGKPREYPYLFVSHLDTCHSADGDVQVRELGDGYLRLGNKEMGCLGADDGVGIYCNLRMIEAGVKGTFLFTKGEERGLIGAEFISEQIPEKLSPFLMSIEVDRQGDDEIIIEQCTGKGASVEFAEALAKCLDMGHKVSYSGIYTDNACFNHLIPENVNIAAGYDRQHTAKERVHIGYVEKLADMLCKVEWGKLPIKRDVTDVGYSDNDYGWSKYDLAGWDSKYGDEFDNAHMTTDTHELYDYTRMTKDEAVRFCRDYPYTVGHYLWKLGLSKGECHEEYVNAPITF